MDLSPLPTWQTLITDYAADIKPVLAPLARDYYARQGRLLTAAAYLALGPVAAAEPFLGNEQALALVDEKQPADQAAGLDFWVPIVARWQEQVQRRLDQEGRLDYLLQADERAEKEAKIEARQPDWRRSEISHIGSGATASPLQSVLTGLYEGLTKDYSVVALGAMPLNQLAKELWRIVGDDQAGLTQLVGWLQKIAGETLDQNYPDADLPAQLLRAAGPDLAPLAQALVQPVSGKTDALLSVAELATKDGGELTQLIGALPANHAFAFALAVWVQQQLRRALPKQAPVPAALAPRVISGQLLGADARPLANFRLALTQQAGDYDEDRGVVKESAWAKSGIKSPHRRIDEAVEEKFRVEAAAPAEAIPAEAIPAEAIPAEAIPAEAIPAEAIPAEAIPAEAIQSDGENEGRPAEPESLVARHSIEADAEEPLAERRVSKRLIGGEDEQAVAVSSKAAALPRDLGIVRTDANGCFALYVPRVSYLDDNDEVAELPTQVQAAVYYPGQAADGEPALVLTLQSPADGAQVPYQTDLTPVAPARASRTVNSLKLPDTLGQLLDKRGLTSLAAVREAGGTAALVSQLAPDDAAAAQAARRLDGLAQLEVVAAGDDDFHEQVVDRGFYSLSQLLDSTSQSEFVALLTTDDPTDTAQAARATTFYRQAAATQALSQALGLLTGGRALVAADAPATTAATKESADDSSTGRLMARFSSLSQLTGQVDAGDGNPATNVSSADFNPSLSKVALTYQASGQCDCPACRSAVSPTAYLAALLKYATQNIREVVAGNPPDPDTLKINSVHDLQQRFLQPYCDLAMSCQSADEPVCQYRLAIEVIQAYWRGTVGGPDLTLAVARPYVEGILDALLLALGTSLTELRALTPTTLTDLATRLALSETVLVTLQQRFAANVLADSRSLDEVEADLAELFGLASTASDPLRTGQLLTQPDTTAAIQLVRWNLQGLEYGSTTDADGRLYLLLEPNGTQPRVTVYAGPPNEDYVVARGTLLESDSATHTFTGLLYPQHGSGLSGAVAAIVTGTEAATFTIAVVSAVTAGQQQQLAAAWLTQDAAAIAPLQAHSTPSWTGFTFLIDPDLLGPDDFRRLDPIQAHMGNTTYLTWYRRYEFLQDGVVTELLAPVATPDGGTADSAYYYSQGTDGGFTAYPGVNPSALFSGQETAALKATAAIGGLGALLNTLPIRSLTYVSGDGIRYSRVPWSGSSFSSYAGVYGEYGNYIGNLTGTAVLERLRADYGGSSAAAPLAAQLLSDLGLSGDALQRLYDLWQLNRTTLLGDADLQEALDIVRQTVKKQFEADWTAEEVAAGLEINTLFFQSVLHEPQVGIWQQLRPTEFGLAAAQLPRLDPDEVTPLDLPDAGLGDRAATIWGNRQAELLQKRQALLASGASTTTPQARADAMFTYAYRPNRFAAPAALPGALPGTPPAALTTLADVVAAVQSDGGSQQTVAQIYLGSTLGLRPAEASRLVELRTQVLTQAADPLWQEMAALLAAGWKRAIAYRGSYVAESAPTPPTGTAPASTPAWLAQEQDEAAFMATPLAYFIGTRKHRLVKWRATAAVRARWVQALVVAGQRPLLDPDQLVPGDFRQAGERSRSAHDPGRVPFLNPAFDLYERRVNQVETWFAIESASWTAAQRLVDQSARHTASWQVIINLLYCSQQELEGLYAQRHANVDVSAALRRLQLTPDGLDLLVTQANGLGSDRTAEVPHLLTQLLRQREYAAWAREEIAQRMIPAPHYFRAPKTEAESLANQPWRSSAVARRQWQRTLKARFAQAQALTAAQQQAVQAAEDQYLPLLRDALLMAKVGKATDLLATRAAFMEDRFLVDFQAVCCQRTTRVAQAQEVLQKLFLELRGGLASNELVLKQDDATFESDWQWLSSYERWRSLMFLYLYPQNVLLPALKPGQTSQFRQTVQGIRQGTGLGPADARQYMDDYQVFLSDMAGLQVGAAVQTTLTPNSTDGFLTAGAGQPVSLHVALSANTTAYANLYYLDSSGATENNYSWTRLPGTTAVSKLVGAAVYQPASGERYAYVFALLLEEQPDTVTNPYASKPVYLAFQRFSLRTLSWDEDYTRLNLSDSATLDANNVVLAHGVDETWAPAVLGLRNKRTPLFTEAPFSQSATGPDLGLQTVLGDYSKYIDLFTAVLDAAGTGVGHEETATFFLIKEAALLGAVRQNKTRIVCATALQAGRAVSASGYYRQEIPYLHMLGIDLTLGRTKPRYIVNAALMRGQSTQAGTALVPGSDEYQNEYFSSSYQGGLFNNVMANLRTVLSYQRGDFENLMRTSGVLTTDDSSGNYLLPLVDSSRTLASSPAAGVRMTGLKVSVRVDNNLAIYYNCRLQNNFELKTYRIPLFLFSFTTFISTGADDTPLYSGSAISEVASSTIATPGQEYRYIGPAVCTTATLAPSPSLSTLREVISYVGLQATLRLSSTNTNTVLLCGTLPALPPLFSSLTISNLDARRTALATIHTATPLGAPGFVSTLVSEAYYALPMLLAQELMRGRNYELALHYFRLIYDYTRLSSTTVPVAGRLVYPALTTIATETYSSDNVLAWLDNPNNPYTLAALRSNAHLEYVVMSVVRCLLAYADNEFTRDTTESVARARTYYELAARLLQQDIAPAVVPDTATLLDPLDVLFPADWLGEWQSIKDVLTRVNQRAVLEQVLNRVEISNANGFGLVGLFTQAQVSSQAQPNTADQIWTTAFDQAWQVVNGQLNALPGGYISLCASANSAAVTTTQVLTGASLPDNSVRPYVPFLDYTAFCIPTNPVPFALALHAELNLFKIRSCRNIAGIQRELDVYAAATDTTTGLPTLSSTGQLVSSGHLVVPATQFRYAYIMERARNLVALAQQTEASLLSALEKRDAEAYNLLKARQDIATNQATVQLQSLRVSEAEDGVDLTGLQLEKSEIMKQQYDGWLSDGLNGYEEDMITAIKVAGTAKAVAAAAAGVNLANFFITGGSSAVVAAANTVAAIADAATQVYQARASYKRREDEWKFQRKLAAQDIKIGQQQIKISNDQLKVVGQEKRIAQLQLDHASAVLNFLTTKFTNAELYDWMSGILESAYGYFLQQATATARLAEQQLAFERQQVPAGLVQEDYYSAPADDLTSASLVASNTGTSATDRKGLTGSVRLLEDLTRLDEYAFETTQRKLQLTKTISLAQSFPTEFVRFRDTGMLRFACQPEWFDQDFPGHYLRILRRVRTSVIALVPPVEGIKARLGTAGTSHVIVDGTPFQTLALPRALEGVALTSPSNATGLFELEQQSTELLYPFEGLGVDVPWTFSMQPASNPNLDYSAVADVLLTLDYSALDSADYARQVVQQLGTDRKQQVVLSLRNRFADQWYDLHHADEVDPAQQYISLLTITADDLPRSLRGASVSQVSLFVDAPLDEDPSVNGAFTDRSHLEVSLVRGAGQGGAGLTNQYGLISTRTGVGAGPLYTGNATAFMPLIGTVPAGNWTLTIGSGRLRDRLAAGLVNDIYLILEVEGDVPTYVL